MEVSFNNHNLIGYQEIYAMSAEEINALNRSTLIEAAALSLYDYHRFEDAYGLNSLVRDMGKESAFLYNLLNADEQKQALDLAANMLEASDKIN
jgi:hypothetical protein